MCFIWMWANLQCSTLLIFCFIQDPDCEIRDKMLREQQSTGWIFTNSLKGRKKHTVYISITTLFKFYYCLHPEKANGTFNSFLKTAHHKTLSTRNTKMNIARDTFKVTISIFCLFHFIKNFFPSKEVTIIGYAIQKPLPTSKI